MTDYRVTLADGTALQIAATSPFYAIHDGLLGTFGRRGLALRVASVEALGPHIPAALPPSPDCSGSLGVGVLDPED